MSDLTSLAFIRARKGKSADLGRALLDLVTPSRAEAGCLHYAIHVSADDPDLWMAYEIWASEAEFDGHFQAPHVQDFVTRLPDLVEGDLDLRRYHLKA
jgi:quinol monooxygenase YgiN